MSQQTTNQPKEQPKDQDFYISERYQDVWYDPYCSRYRHMRQGIPYSYGAYIWTGCTNGRKFFEIGTRPESRGGRDYPHYFNKIEFYCNKDGKWILKSTDMERLYFGLNLSSDGMKESIQKVFLKLQQTIASDVFDCPREIMEVPGFEDISAEYSSKCYQENEGIFGGFKMIIIKEVFFEKNGDKVTITPRDTEK